MMHTSHSTHSTSRPCFNNQELGVLPKCGLARREVLGQIGECSSSHEGLPRSSGSWSGFWGDVAPHFHSFPLLLPGEPRVWWRSKKCCQKRGSVVLSFGEENPLQCSLVRQALLHIALLPLSQGSGHSPKVPEFRKHLDNAFRHKV